MNEVAIEGFRAAIVLAITVILTWKHGDSKLGERTGFPLILLGFYLLLFASLLDITDNFPALSALVVMGETPVEAFLEKVVGYTGGFLFVAVGLVRWLPMVRESERNRATLAHSREELAESERRFRELAMMLPEIVFETDPAGNLTFINETAFSVTGFTRGELAMGINIDWLFDVSAGEGECSLKAFLNGAANEGVECHLRRRGGPPIPVLVCSAPYSEGGHLAGVRGIIADLRKIKDMESRLLQAQKMEALGTLAGGVAHDFNNMLQGISGFANLAIESGKLDDKDRARIKRIDEICDRAAGLVKGLLAFSRKTEPNLVELDMNHEVSDAVELLGRTLPKSVAIETRMAGGDMCFSGDASQFLQILINLATNAGDAMCGSGTIVISTGRAAVHDKNGEPDLPPGEYLRLSVTDKGVGIGCEEMRDIFNPFYTTKEVGKGTGLGLAIVFGLVQAHGGAITCDSEKGRGTTFNVYFPALSECHTMLDPAAEQEEPENTAPLSVLLVDDNHEVVETISEALKGKGFAIRHAYCGEEAIKVYRDQRSQIDAVLLDVGMPGMGGLACLRELRAINPECRVVIATGYSFREIPTDSLGKPADALLNKPYRMGDLMHALRPSLDAGQGWQCKR